MYHVIYDEKGQMFEVTIRQLEKLVVEKGWTLTYPFRVEDIFKDLEEK